MEIGALAAWTPAKIARIEPYAAIYYPKVFAQKDTAILTVAPERTFWEKATILHHEANRPESSEMPQRYSRHLEACSPGVSLCSIGRRLRSNEGLLYGDVPTFETVMSAVSELEKEINAL